MATDTATANADASEFARIDIIDRLSKIEATLLTQDPQIPVHLNAILKTMQNYEELVHLMDDAKITVLMAGMKKHRMVQLVKEAQTSKGKKALSKTTVDDI